MADPTPSHAPVEDASAGLAADGESVRDGTGWANLWQVPSILVSLGLIALGFVTFVRGPEPPTLTELLDQAEAMVLDTAIEAEELEQASTFLNQTIKPRLREATDAERGRFHALVADWLVFSQEYYDVTVEENNRHIVEQYLHAKRAGLHLSPDRLLRWVKALIDLGQTDEALARLDEMDILAAGSRIDDRARRQRNAALKILVDHAMRSGELQQAAVAGLLDRLENDPRLELDDRIWALARRAELLLADQRPHEAIDMLLLEMRRIEAANPGGGHQFGTLHVLLGKAYFAIREEAIAEDHLNLALDALPSGHADRGEARLLLGRLEQSRNEYHRAFELYDLVIRDHANTPAEYRARLGRAEVLSILGDHDRAIEDYTHLRDLLMRPDVTSQVDPELVAASLINRHDASLAGVKLDLALQYALLAESMFGSRPAPADVLLRVASTSRQLADNLLGHDPEDEAVAHGPWYPKKMISEVPIERRREANEHYRRAGEYYTRHASATKDDPGADQLWADSLWMAADSFDRAGWHDIAIERFTEYRAGRSEADPRYSQAGLRLGLAHAALMQYEQAVAILEQVIEESPRSPAASQSYVPLARAYAMVGRDADARQMLEQVLRGERFIDPDALDYRSALIEYGRLQYESGAYVSAIEHLDDAVQRYPDDPRIHQVRYWLADSYRKLAHQLLADDEAVAAMAPAKRRELTEQHDEYLRRAMTLFGLVISGLEEVGEARLTATQRSTKRLAHLYRGDCAFDIGDYEQAITFYDQTARAYSSHHASLIALVQVVNSYYAMGETDKARAAEQRARVRLQQLPDEAFSAEDALMDRRAWERWMANNPPGTARADANTGT